MSDSTTSSTARAGLVETCKEELEQVAERVIKEGENYLKSIRNSSKKPFNTIYHYTSADSALKILKSGKLWFTERAHLNDPSEIQFGIKIAARIAEELASPKIAHWLSHLRTRFEEPHAYYIASFSVDDNSLPQWRAYANDGRGIALGFSPNAFDQDHPDFTILSGVPTTFLVRYDEAQLECFQRQLILPVLKLAENGALDSEIQTYLAFYVILNSLQFKHPAHSTRLAIAKPKNARV